MIEATGLQFSYPDSSPLEFPDLRCAPREHWLILGESGCGKTTYLHLLAGLRTPTSGMVSIDGTNLHALNGRERDRFRGRHIGLVLQTPHFLQALTINENVLLAQKLAGHPLDTSRVQTMLDRLGIAHRAQAYPRQCSQGELQRASIARALINRPALLLADEPTSALDDTHCREVLNLLEEHSDASNATLVIVTHDQRLKGQIPHTITLRPHV